MEAMNANLRSANISLRLQGFGGNEEQLWQTFRRTAVEPGQVSSPDFISFADECLLCAQIVANAEDLNDEGLDSNRSTWDATAQDWPTDSPLQSSVSDLSPLLESRKLGFIYLHAGPANLPAGEANVGVIIKRGMQGRGYAREAVQLVVRWAFEDLKFHRVQAAVLDTPFKDRALRLFIGSGFAHEGTKRRAVYQPEGEGMAGMWKDVTYLAILDTEWMLRSTLRAQRNNYTLERPVISVWDEMFARHSREREELVRWEEKHGRVRRSSSTETLRECAGSAAQDVAYLTDDAASSVGDPSINGSVPSSPRPDLVVTWGEHAQMADTLGAHNLDLGWEHVVETSYAARRQRQESEDPFLDLSPRGPTLALPSIPSIRLSEGNPQSPMTIPSPRSASVPPFSPSPSPVPSSSVQSSWSEDEDEGRWQQEWESRFASAPIQPTMSTDAHSRTVPAGFRTRSRSNSASSSSADSWSDAPSSVCTSWDMLSNASDEPLQ